MISTKLFHNLLNITAILFFIVITTLYVLEGDPKESINTLHKYNVNLPYQTSDGICVNVNMTILTLMKRNYLNSTNMF